LFFLSRLAYATRQPISDLYSLAGSAGYGPRINQPRGTGDLRYREPPQLDLQHEDTSDLRLALALFREGLSSGSVYYSFLSYWKVIQLAFGEQGQRINRWVEQSILRISLVRSQEWLDQHGLTPATAGEHLWETGRNAIAHVSREPRVNPDEPRDRRRMAEDLEIARGLAELAIRQGLFSRAVESTAKDR
jgi:hypothetical protein